METAGINWLLAVAQLINLALFVTWVALAIVALLRLRRAGLSAGLTLGWAALIVLVPILGAVAFLTVRPRSSA